MVSSYSEQNLSLARQGVIKEAEAHFNNMVITRRWVAMHGGVYVDKKPGMEPNPYLRNNHIFDSEQRMLVKINPAWMTRQISKLANQNSNYYYKITSLKPLNPANKSDVFETEALQYFEKSTENKSYYRFNQEEGGTFDYMGALVTEKPCLKCHRHQGYKLGEIRGGIRVSLPLELYNQSVDGIVKQRNLSVSFTIIVAIFIIIAFQLYMMRLIRVERELELARDNLEEKVVERTHELKSSEAKFRAVTETALDAVVTVNREGVITQWNMGATEIFGYQDREVVGQPLTLLIPDRYRDSHERAFVRFMSGDKSLLRAGFETTALQKNGDEVPLELSLSGWDIEGERFVTSIMRNISERRAAEAAIQRSHEQELIAQQAEAANEAKSAFLASMSHELRTPLSSIIGNGEILGDTPLTEEQYELLHAMALALTQIDPPSAHEVDTAGLRVDKA